LSPLVRALIPPACREQQPTDQSSREETLVLFIRLIPLLQRRSSVLLPSGAKRSNRSHRRSRRPVSPKLKRIEDAPLPDHIVSAR